MGDAPSVTGFILAGGKSTRMGTDKAFVIFNGRTLLDRALDLVRSVTPDVCIVGARQKFAGLAPIVEDEFRDCGPLGGIHAALRASPSDLNLMLAVDMPFVPREFLEYMLVEARRAATASIVVPGGRGRWQPLCAVYRRKFVGHAEEALRTGCYKIDSLFFAGDTRVIDEQELSHAGFSEQMFGNVNTMEELEQQQRRA